MAEDCDIERRKKKSTLGGVESKPKNSNIELKFFLNNELCNYRERMTDFRFLAKKIFNSDLN